MKTISSFPGNKFVAIIVLVALIFILNPLFSQDSPHNPPQKKQMKLIVKTDKNGESRELDTTINLNGQMDKARLKKVMKEFDINLEDLADNMQDMVISIDDMDLPDSTKVDSLCKMVKKIRINLRDGKEPMGKRDHGRTHAYTFDYNFDDPCLPDVPPPPPPPSDGNLGIFEGHSGFEPWNNNFDEKGNTLSDILGDIPMDRVKSYSIKETRNGKRIVIELNNDPMIERHDKVIIIREPRHKSSLNHTRNPRMNKKVTIMRGGEDQNEVK
jgi:hypothetical protein